MITIVRSSAALLATTAGFDLRPDATALVCETVGMVGHESIVWTDVVGSPAAHLAPARVVYAIAE